MQHTQSPEKAVPDLHISRKKTKTWCFYCEKSFKFKVSFRKTEENWMGQKSSILDLNCLNIFTEFQSYIDTFL